MSVFEGESIEDLKHVTHMELCVVVCFQMVYMVGGIIKEGYP